MSLRAAPMAAALPLALAIASAIAQDYPAKPIRYLVPLSAGGPTDTQARWVAQKLTAAFGQQVIVENRPGAGGMIGTQAAARSAADGYTLLAANPGPLTVAPAITVSLGYDTMRDFAPVTLVAKSASVLVVHPSVPVKTVREFIGYARANPGRINYATPGVGTVGHLTQEFFAHQTGIRITHVPYKGGVNQYTVELMAGQIDSAMMQIFSVAPFIKQGRLRPLGVSSLTRSPVLPEVAPISEQGVKDFESYNWNGVLVPAKTPAAIVNRLHAVISAAVNDSRDYFIKQGQEPGGEGLEQFGAFIRSEIARYEKVARLANVPKQ